MSTFSLDEFNLKLNVNLSIAKEGFHIIRSLINVDLISSTVDALKKQYKYSPMGWKSISDFQNYYQYFDDNTINTKVTKCIHQISLGHWGHHNLLQERIIANLNPLINLSNSLNGAIKDINSFPSSGYCSRFTFNSYPLSSGFIDMHTDPSWQLHKYQILLILSEYPYEGKQGLWVDLNGQRRWISEQRLSFGDVVIFDHSKLHGVSHIISDKPATKQQSPSSFGDFGSTLDCVFYNIRFSQNN